MKLIDFVKNYKKDAGDIRFDELCNLWKNHCLTDEQKTEMDSLIEGDDIEIAFVKDGEIAVVDVFGVQYDNAPLDFLWEVNWYVLRPDTNDGDDSWADGGGYYGYRSPIKLIADSPYAGNYDKAYDVTQVWTTVQDLSYEKTLEKLNGMEEAEYEQI